MKKFIYIIFTIMCLIATPLTSINGQGYVSRKINTEYFKKNFNIDLSNHKYYEVDGGDVTPDRIPNALVDIGYGDREYWAVTNKYGQLVYVFANEIVLQDEKSEKVDSKGRYYSDMAKVQGTEYPTLDRGHVIADSLGGVSNAYNITPQDSELNRSGDQAYMEKTIRDNKGAKNFLAIIRYDSPDTQIPSSYEYHYTIKGFLGIDNKIIDKFNNVDPEIYNKNNIVENTPKHDTTKTDPLSNWEISGIESYNNSNSYYSDSNDGYNNSDNSIYSIDSDGNGIITIKEAKMAGFTMPIRSDHWLYPYMIDRDGDGMVGE